MNDDKRNASGCMDLTAYEAITRLEAEEKHFKELIRTIRYICRLAGFEVVGKVTLKHHRSGRIYK